MVSDRLTGCTVDELKHGMTEPIDERARARELVARARGGDERAFTQLVRDHETDARRLAAFLCGSTEEANDVTQDAFLTAYVRLGALSDDGAFRPWLMRIVANSAKNVRRASSRRRRRELRDAAFVRPAPVLADDAAIDAVEADVLWSALGALGERERSVLALRYAAGLSEAETAEALGVPAGTVKSRAARAIERLREQMPDQRSVRR